MNYSEEQKAKFFLNSIYKKAWEDQQFLKELVENPMAALNKFTKRTGKLPVGKKLVVEDQTNSNHIYLNIPANPANRSNRELNESQLDQVTGGSEDGSSNSWSHAFYNLRAEIKNLFDS
jgi:hypothetical protein